MIYEIKTCGDCGADTTREGHRFHCPEFVSLAERMEKLASVDDRPQYQRSRACVNCGDDTNRIAGLDRLCAKCDTGGHAGVKPSNPKDAVGIKKAPMSTVSAPVMLELGTAMLEGALKYGRHNYRTVGIRGSIYYDATMRHLMQWWEGEDVDPDSGLSHITKAIASLVVLRDAMLQSKFNDDRPPKASAQWYGGLNKRAGELIDKYPEPKPAFTEKAE